MTAGLAIEPHKIGPAAKAGWVVYALGGRKCALPLALVDRVVPAVEITPLPQAPRQIAGVINVQGRIVPVVDARARLGMPPREVDVNDHFLMVRSGSRLLALLVDQVEDVVQCAAHEMVPADQIAPGMNLHGALRLEDGTIVLLEDGNHLLQGTEHDQMELPMEPQVKT